MLKTKNEEIELMPVNYWLLKTEPEDFSISDLAAKGDAGEPWNGIRNYQARNFLRDMAVGDLAFIYHSACNVPAIVGLSRVIRDAYPDTDALNGKSKYFDTKSTPDNIRWSCVDVSFVEKFENPLTLKTMKQQSALADMKLLKSSRLSVSPVTTDEFKFIMLMLKPK
jgi:predicted RNA-binding protein with PUA-like domain